MWNPRRFVDVIKLEKSFKYEKNIILINDETMETVKMSYEKW